MSAVPTNSDIRRLQALWAKWTNAIARSSLPGWRRPELTDEQFTRLRQPLLQLCRELACQASDGQQRGMLLRMQELVEPWTSVKSLSRVDRKYLARLIIESRELGRQIGSQRRSGLLPRWSFWLLLAFLVAVTCWLVAGFGGTVAALRELVQSAVGLIQSTNFVHRFAVATAAVLALGIFLLQKTRRF